MQWKHQQGIGKGIITGCDEHLEWMLPWWWFNYSLHNSYPVIFLDFGMTKNGRTWCEKHGTVIEVTDVPGSEKSGVSDELVDLWENKIHGKLIWDIRKIWFKKPLGLLATPFEKSIWIDMDCEVQGSLDCLFHLCENEGGIAVLEEYECVQEYLVSIKAQLPEERNFNSGVIVFRHGAPLISIWVKKTIYENHLFFGDQDVLSRAIFENKQLNFSRLSPSANWFIHIFEIPNQELPQVLIRHFTGRKGKQMILLKIKKICNSFVWKTLDCEELWSDFFKVGSLN